MTGVRPHKGKWWRAIVSTGGRQHYIGIYATEREAIAAYRKAARKLGVPVKQPRAARKSHSARVASRNQTRPCNEAT